MLYKVLNDKFNSQKVNKRFILYKLLLKIMGQLSVIYLNVN